MAAAVILTLISGSWGHDCALIPFFSDSYEQWHFPSRCELSWVCVLLTPRHEFRCQGSEINAHVRLNFLGPRCYMYIRECVPPACFTMKTQVIETAQFRTTRCHVYISVCACGCSLPPDYFPSGSFEVCVCILNSAWHAPIYQRKIAWISSVFDLTFGQIRASLRRSTLSINRFAALSTHSFMRWCNLCFLVCCLSLCTPLVF